MGIHTIAIVMAMEEEARPIIEKLHFFSSRSLLHPTLPMIGYSGEYERLSIALITNGKDKDYHVDCIATQPATLATFLAIEKFHPDIIISAGTAGGFKKRGAEIGDVYLSSGMIRYHDRRIPIAGFRAYGIGSYGVRPVSQMAKALGLKLGVISTGNSLDATEKDMEMLIQNDASVKDMEAAAVAWVAQLYGIPMIALKAITDFVDAGAPSHEQFLKNFTVASRYLQEKLVDLLFYCSRNTLL